MNADTPRDILARNVRKMIDKQGLSVRAWAMGKGLDVRLIDRLVKGEHAVTLDTVDKIAAACDVPAWQLLLPDFEPGAQIDAPLTDGEKDMLRRLKSLLA